MTSWRGFAYQTEKGEGMSSHFLNVSSATEPLLAATGKLLFKKNESKYVLGSVIESLLVIIP